MAPTSLRASRQKPIAMSKLRRTSRQRSVGVPDRPMRRDLALRPLPPFSGASFYQYSLFPVFLLCEDQLILFIFHQLVSPQQYPPNKRCPMHSIPLWICAVLYFATLFFWQSHYVSTLDQAFRFPSYQSIPLASDTN
jgi:hypothetical protein